MERLTKKDENGFLIIPNIELVKQTRVLNNYTEKLSQKEDDEEELGIDSHILFKALRDGFYAITNKEPKTIGFIQGGELYLRLCLQTKRIHTLGSNEDYYFDDYGITWALTKKELEK